MHIISSSSNYPFGLDISDNAVKLIQLNKRRSAITLQAIGKWRLPRHAIENGVIKNKTSVARAINQAMTKTIFGKITSRQVIANLPETKTFIKLISIKTGSENFKEALIHEIEKNIPYSIEEVNYDWQVTSKSGDEKKVLIAAVDKKIAHQYHDLLVEAELSPLSLEVEAVAIARSLLPPNMKKKDAVLIIDIGARRSSCIAYANNSILFTMSLPISGNAITDIVAKKLKISDAKAENAKIVCGLDACHANGVVAKELEKTIDNLIKKIKKVIVHLKSHHPEYDNLTDIYLCGGGTQINGLTDLISKKVKIPTYVGNVLFNLNVNRRIEKKYLYEEFATLKKITKDHKIRQNFSLQFATAVGLALRGVYYEEH